MVWGAFGYFGKSELQRVDPKSDSLAYQNILSNGLLGNGTRMGGRGWIFQQDNASIHNSASTRAWLSSKKVRVLPWPARSPDLNPIENVWGYLARRVYAHGRQFATVAELQQTIFEEWDAIPQDYLRTLTESMPNRIFNTIRNGGNSSGY